MRTIVIMGTGTPCDIHIAGAELWACNRAHKIQTAPPIDPCAPPSPKGAPVFAPGPWPKIDRIYCMDGVDANANPADSIAAWNTLRVPVFLPAADARIPTSRAFPLDVIRGLGSPDYFLCTPAYMMAHAISEWPDRIVLWRLFRNPKHVEYLPQKPCMDYWVGFGRARGIKVDVTRDSYIGQPLYPYLSPLYGYERPNAATEGMKAFWDAGAAPTFEEIPSSELLESAEV